MPKVRSIDRCALVRYNADGSLDTSFNGSGKLITAIGAGCHGEGVALQGDGRIVVAGDSPNASGRLRLHGVTVHADGSSTQASGVQAK